ncbi:hypothetical protein BVY03_05430, partial [bacterium K02(2017)]
LGVSGASTYTVGQSGGTYTIGSAGAVMQQGDWYWRGVGLGSGWRGSAWGNAHFLGGAFLTTGDMGV